MQAGVDLEVDLQPPAGGLQRPGVGGAHQRLGQPVPGQQGGLLRARAAQNQDGPPDAAPAQPRPLGGGGHSEGGHPLVGADPGNLQIPVAVGVGLHHRHEGGPRRQQGGQGGQVVPQGPGVDLRPRPGVRPGPGGPPEGEGEGQQGGEQGYGGVVPQAVVHEKPGEAGGPRPAPHQHDAPGVEDIHRRRPPPEGGDGGQLQGGQPQKQKAHAQGQGEVEGVKPGQFQRLHQQALPRQQGHGEEQQRPAGRHPMPPGAAGQQAAQQQEDGGGEQAVAGVVEAEEHGLVRRPQGRQGGGQAVPAVPQHAEDIEQPGWDPRPPPQPPHQGPDDAGSQDQGGEVPQVVEGAVEKDVPQQVRPRLRQGVVIEVQGQVEQGGQGVQPQDLLQEGTQGGRPLPLQPGHQEPAADGEEEGHGNAAPDVGDQVVG